MIFVFSPSFLSILFEEHGDHLEKSTFHSWSNKFRFQAVGFVGHSSIETRSCFFQDIPQRLNKSFHGKRLKISFQDIQYYWINRDTIEFPGKRSDQTNAYISTVGFPGHFNPRTLNRDIDTDDFPGHSSLETKNISPGHSSHPGAPSPANAFPSTSPTPFDEVSIHLYSSISSKSHHNMLPRYQGSKVILSAWAS